MKTSTRLALLATLGLISAMGGVSAAHAQDAAACSGLLASAEKTLGATGSSAAGPVTYVGLADAAGCNVGFSGTGEVYGTSFQAVANKLDAMLTGQGWTRDHNADADGPTGTATGYRKGAQAISLGVEYDTAPGVCRDDAPVASCHPTAAQMNYTIVLGLRPAS